MKPPDPKDHVAITRVTKRGEWYTVEGHVKGQKMECHIPAPTLESKDRRAAEALARRSLYGTAALKRDRQ